MMRKRRRRSRFSFSFLVENLFSLSYNRHLHMQDSHAFSFIHMKRQFCDEWESLKVFFFENRKFLLHSFCIRVRLVNFLILTLFFGMKISISLFILPTFSIITMMMSVYAFLFIRFLYLYIVLYMTFLPNINSVLLHAFRLSFVYKTFFFAFCESFIHVYKAFHFSVNLFSTSGCKIFSEAYEWERKYNNLEFFRLSSWTTFNSFILG